MEQKKDDPRNLEAYYQMILVIGGKYQGKHRFVSEKFGDTKAFEFETLLNSPGGVPGFLDKVSGDTSDTGSLTVVIADENSSGIVPDNVDEIRFREEYNKNLLMLSEEAKEVYRVFCGIGMKIK